MWFRGFPGPIPPIQQPVSVKLPMFKTTGLQQSSGDTVEVAAPVKKRFLMMTLLAAETIKPERTSITGPLVVGS